MKIVKQKKHQFGEKDGKVNLERKLFYAMPVRNNFTFFYFFFLLSKVDFIFKKVTFVHFVSKYILQIFLLIMNMLMNLLNVLNVFIE